MAKKPKMENGSNIVTNSTKTLGGKKKAQIKRSLKKNSRERMKSSKESCRPSTINAGAQKKECSSGWGL